jgi:hypothetical protein
MEVIEKVWMLPLGTGACLCTVELGHRLSIESRSDTTVGMRTERMY